MIYYKTWKVFPVGHTFDQTIVKEHIYIGWFLFGIIPLYISRRTIYK